MYVFWNVSKIYLGTLMDEEIRQLKWIHFTFIDLITFTVNLGFQDVPLDETLHEFL